MGQSNSTEQHQEQHCSTKEQHCSKKGYLLGDDTEARDFENLSQDSDDDADDRDSQPENDDKHGSQGETSTIIPLPAKNLLLYILDKFAKNIADRVSSDSHEVLQNPDMDFGTMRNKLEQGIYTNFDHFVNDLLLICSAAIAHVSPRHEEQRVSSPSPPPSPYNKSSNSRKRRKYKRWTELEEQTLESAMTEYEVIGNWKAILNSHKDIWQERTAVDLKDKWRNMSRKRAKQQQQHN